MTYRNKNTSTFEGKDKSPLTGDFIYLLNQAGGFILNQAGGRIIAKFIPGVKKRDKNLSTWNGKPKS